MVLMLLLTATASLPLGTAASSCCDPPPDLTDLGPPPKPPWITYDLACNGSGVLVLGADYSTASSLPDNDAAHTSAGGGALDAGEIAAIVLSTLAALWIIALLVYFCYRKKNGHRVKPAPLKEEDNYLYNYRILGRKWVDGRREGTDDRVALVSSTPTSQMSLSSNGSTDGTTVSNGMSPSGNRSSSETSGICVSESDQHHTETEKKTKRKSRTSNIDKRCQTREIKDSERLDYPNRVGFKGPLPILAPIQSSADPTRSNGLHNSNRTRESSGSSTPNLWGTTSNRRARTLSPIQDSSDVYRKSRRRRKYPTLPTMFKSSDDDLALDTMPKEKHCFSYTLKKNGESLA